MRFAGLREALANVADSERAAPMSAYLKHREPFLGVKSPDRKRVQRPFLAAGRGLSSSTLLGDAAQLWTEREREFQYVAMDDLRRWSRQLDADALSAVCQLIRTRSWWDTVDALAVHVVGPLVKTHGLQTTMDQWIEADDLWVVRTALLHQLMYKADTDSERLFGYCEHQMGQRDFFVRKAIGWALRQYAREDPDAVRRFVEAHDNELSGLSKREALKHIRRES